MAAAAVLFSDCVPVGANRGDAVAARNAAKSGTGAQTWREPRSAAEGGRAPRSAVRRSRITLTHKLPALRASQGYVSVSAYGDDLAGLRAQLEAKGLKDAVVHATAVSGKAPVAALRDMAETQRPQVPAAHAGDARAGIR